jgi:hypothetical protein
MRLMLISLPLLGPVWFSICTVPVAGQADEPAKLTVAKEAPPTELAAEIRSVLQPTAVRLAEENEPFFEFWFRKEIPLAEKPDEDSFAMTAVKEGTILGALKVYDERYDFKDEEIPPGVYVLRFCLQPEDGDHLGTSPTDTFVVLIPAKDDRKLDAFSDHDDLAEASAIVNAAEHPSNLNLQPVTEAGGEFPRLASHRDGDHKVICLRLPAKVKGANDQLTLTFALVYEGMGQI